MSTVAYLGPEARAVEVQVQLSPNVPAFIIVGLVDEAVAESRERAHAALSAIGVALSPKRITVNLSPVDLPIALGLLAAIGACDAESLGIVSQWASWGWTGGARRARACCWPRCMRRRRARG